MYHSPITNRHLTYSTGMQTLKAEQRNIKMLIPFQPDIITNEQETTNLIPQADI